MTCLLRSRELAQGDFTALSFQTVVPLPHQVLFRIFQNCPPPRDPCTLIALPHFHLSQIRGALGAVAGSHYHHVSYSSSLLR